MSVILMKAMEQQVASLSRQVKDLAAKNAALVEENERVRNLLTEFAAKNAALARMQLRTAADQERG